MACRLFVRLSKIGNRHTCSPSRAFHASSDLNARPLKKAGGKSGPQIKKVILDVETDPKKLVTKCCGANIYVDGSDPDLKPDSEYPDWLWTLRTDPTPIPLEELDPESIQYWQKLRKIKIKQKNEELKRQKY